MTLIDFVFPKLRTPNIWSDKCLKSPISQDPSISNMVKVAKHCWNLHTIFIILIELNDKLSLLKTGYFSLEANVLTSSPKIWHVKNKGILQLNWLDSDQWIW